MRIMCFLLVSLAILGDFKKQNKTQKTLGTHKIFLCK